MAEPRKLAAILVSDVAGYSRLAGADEDRALARLRALRSDLIDPINAVHHGRVVKRTGDGAIVEFRSVVDAVRCAIEVQHGMVERNAGVPAERRIEFRIGIHLGDVVEESDGDLMGEGVNIAARLQSVAKPGGICLSEDAYRHVNGRLDLKVSDLGPTQLKNIAEPVRIYALDIGKHAEAQSAKPATPALAKKNSLLAPLVVGVASLCVIAAVSVWLFQNLHQSAPADPGHLSMVVLPFANLSGDPNQDYFADGVTENLAQGRYDTSIDEYHRALDGGYQSYITYSGLAAALVLGGKVEEAKTALAEARRLNPKLTVKSLIEHTPNIPTLFEGLRKAGLQEE